MDHLLLLFLLECASTMGKSGLVGIFRLRLTAVQPELISVVSPRSGAPSGFVLRLVRRRVPVAGDLVVLITGSSDD